MQETSHVHAHTSNKVSSSLLSSSIACLGIIYGDIGTSPLYVFSSIFVDEQPSSDDILGAASLIIWSLTILCTLKYICFILRADADGEGGTFALLTLIRQGMREYSREQPYLARALAAHAGDTVEQSDQQSPSSPSASVRLDYFTDLTRHVEVHSAPSSPESVRAQLHPSTSEHLTWDQRLHAAIFVRLDSVLTCLSFVAAGLLIGDGVLTPAISILSAVEGIAVRQPSLQSSVLPVALLIILVLFLLQRFGTAKVSVVFAPIMLLWFVMLGGIGIANITQLPSVLSALSPHHAILFFVRRGQRAWLQLGGVVLCMTGVEAMYADLGHFSIASVRASWCMLVYPSLILAYLGQASVLSQQPNAIGNAFFHAVPHAIYWPMLLLSTCATVIASQALISGSFSLVSAATKLDFLPHLRLKHTSVGHEGQIYISSVNYALMAATLLVVLVFRESAALANAYGLAVCFVMCITTIMYAAVIRYLWRRSMWLLSLWCITFLFIDVAFLSSNLLKIFSGGYLPLIFASVVTTVMYVWQWGRSQVKARRRIGDPASDATRNNTPPGQLPMYVHASRTAPIDDMHLLQQLADTIPSSSSSGARAGSNDAVPLISVMPSVGIFLTSSAERIPHSAWQLLTRLHAFPSRCIFLTIEFLQQPFIDSAQRMRIYPVWTRGIARCARRRERDEPGTTPLLDGVAVKVECESTSASPHDQTSSHFAGSDPSSSLLDRFEVYRVVVQYGFAEHRVSMETIVADLFPKLHAMQVDDETQAIANDDTVAAGRNVFELDIDVVEWPVDVEECTMPVKPVVCSPFERIESNGVAMVRIAATVAWPVTYFLTYESLVCSPELDSNAPVPRCSDAALMRWVRRSVRRALVMSFNFITRNSDSAAAYFAIPTNQGQGTP